MTMSDRVRVRRVRATTGRSPGPGAESGCLAPASQTRCTSMHLPPEIASRCSTLSGIPANGPFALVSVTMAWMAGEDGRDAVTRSMSCRLLGAAGASSIGSAAAVGATKAAPHPLHWNTS